MATNILDTSIEFLKGVGPHRAELLKKEMQIYSFNDLITFYPFRYVDRTKFYKINEVDGNLAFVQLKGKIIRLETVGVKRSKRLIAYFTDGNSQMELVWFQGIKWVMDILKPNVEYIIFGKPTFFKGKLNIAHPEIDLVSENSNALTTSLQPIYNSSEKLKTSGLDSKGISKLQKILITILKNHVPEILSEDIIYKLKLISRESALKSIHFPEDVENLKKAEFRLKFEELFFVQLKLLKLKLIRQKDYVGFNFSKIGNYFNNFYTQHLPFELTNAQKRVLKEIRQDAGSGKQMNRLLQGDVGSGKTLVALMTMLMALDNGYQACIMAPTEILANQHFETISGLLHKMDIKIGILTGSSKTAARKKLHQELLSGEIKILIGTHALLEDIVQFQNLGMVVIDEQHRFGVAQRAKLWKKNIQPPHMLIMTATPIPRTLAMTLYGDLDTSIIDELPPGRKPISTVHKFDSNRLHVFGFIKEQIKLGRQIYIVYPLIEESETMDYKDLMDGYASITSAFPSPEYQVSIVHGKMKAADKDFEMQRFAKKETQIMVATTVIEVGVNIPNASVMIIESAERFGLSQLHQLRGRVGRGADQSYCILMTSYKLGADSKKRLETMVRTNDGFEIADVDLQLRGPGDIAGTQQSGVLDLRIANLARDGQILQYARNIAVELLEDDPELKKSQNSKIVNHLNFLNKNSTNWSRIS